MAKGAKWTAKEAARKLLDRCGQLVVCCEPAFPKSAGTTETYTFGGVYVGIKLLYARRGTLGEWQAQRRLFLAHGCYMPPRPSETHPDIWILTEIK